MTDGLIQIWERECEEANAEVERISDQYYEGGTYLEGDAERYWELDCVQAADERLAIAEETLQQLAKLTS